MMPLVEKRLTSKRLTLASSHNSSPLKEAFATNDTIENNDEIIIASPIHREVIMPKKHRFNNFTIEPND